MSNPTTPFGWQMPTSTDLVTDLPADFEVFGQAVATSMADLLGGTTGQVLSKTTNADMDFTWVSANPGDITSVGVTTPITGGGTSGDVTIGIQDGTTTQKGAVQLENSTSSTSTTTAAVPASVKSAYDLANGAIPKTLTTTTGDTIYASAANTPARLGVGTTGQVLTVAGGLPTWATPAGGGGMTLLATTTLSGASTTISSISGSYKNLLFIITGVNISTAAQFYLSSNGNFGDWYEIYGEAGGVAWTENNGNDLYPTATSLASGNANNAFAVLIYNYASTSTYKPFNCTGTYGTSIPSNRNHFSAGTWRNTTAISSMKFSTGAGSFNGGTVLTYGVS